jgi:hypothetical protein
MENEPLQYNPDQLVFSFHENEQVVDTRTLHFSKELFEKLLADGERIYDWFKEGQPSLHKLDPEDYDIICR